MKNEKNYMGFLIHKIYQILKRFAGTFRWAQTSYFWRVKYYFLIFFIPKILDNNGDDVGKISKQWMGCFTEVFTNTDTFKIKFPENATLEIKAALFGATMLVVSCWYLLYR